MLYIQSSMAVKQHSFRLSGDPLVNCWLLTLSNAVHSSLHGTKATLRNPNPWRSPGRYLMPCGRHAFMNATICYGNKAPLLTVLPGPPPDAVQRSVMAHPSVLNMSMKPGPFGCIYHKIYCGSARSCSNIINVIKHARHTIFFWA